MATWCGRPGYPHPAHDECLGYDHEALELARMNWRADSGMTEEAAERLRGQRRAEG